MSIQPWFFPSLVALALWGVTVVIPKITTGKIRPAHLTVYQAFLFFMVICVFKAIKGFSLQLEVLPVFLSVLVGVAGITGQYFYNRALRDGPIIYTSVLISMYPVISTLLAIIFLGERFLSHQWAGFFLAVFSAVFIAWGQYRSSSDRITDVNGGWLVTAFVTLFLWGIWGFLPKVALQRIDVYNAVFFEAAGGVIAVVPVALRERLRFDFHAKSLLITSVSCCCTAVAIFSFLYALQSGPVSIVVPLTALYPVVSIVLACLFFEEKLDRVKILSIASALTAVVLLSK